MSKLSKEKLNEIKRSKNYTSQEIAQHSGIPKSTIEKIFGGFNKNPTIDILQKIADVFDCGIDDFMEYEKEPSSPFYKDRTAIQLMDYIYDKKELKKLINVSKTLNCDDINILITLAERLSDKK